MTEQEKREKAIEEMVIYGNRCSCNGPNIGWFNCKRCKYRPCAAYEYCADLYDADYRKAEEVMKETAKSIIGILNVEKGLRPNVVTDYQDRIDNVINFIKREFCNEV